MKLTSVSSAFSEERYTQPACVDRAPVCFFCGNSWCCSAPSLVGRDVSVQTTPLSLEEMFRQKATTIDLSKIPNFGSFLSPNEGQVWDLLNYLPKTRGVDVVTGTERAFFLLALRGANSEGLVVRDIHPHVKAYVDFNTLLLRIARDKEHYVELSTSPEKLEEIRTLMEKEASLPPHMKQYYRDHLDAFAKIYFEETKKPGYWRNNLKFNWVRYYADETLFLQLQQHARSGNIIATVGDISDLRFLDQRTIATLDISNIPDYVILNIQTRSKPTIITTYPNNGNTRYASSMHHPLTDPQIKELGELLGICYQIFGKDYSFPEMFGNDLHHLLMLGKRFFEVNSYVYSEGLLNTLRKHKDQYWVQIGDKWIDFSPEGNGEKWLDYLKESDVQNFTLDECLALKQRVLPMLPVWHQNKLSAIHARLAEGK